MPRPQAPRNDREAPVAAASRGGAATGSPPIELEQLHEIIQSAGLHRTGPRVAVLQALMSAQAPLSHAELSEQLKPDGVGSATIYANLKALSSVGVVHRVDLGDHVWRYELAQNGQRGSRPSRERLHFLCSKCGRVSPLPGTTVNITVSPQAPKSATAGNFETFLRGVCDDCDGEGAD